MTSTMNLKVIGIGEYDVTREPGCGLRTFGLGSCVAVVIMDPATRCVAMDHVALPESSISRDKAKRFPGHFADTGIPALLEAMKRAGVDGKPRSYIVKLAGGANVMDPNNTFNIGKRNVLAVKKALWRYGMGAAVEDVGDRISRTVTVDVDTGTVRISSPARGEWEL